jgi:hypothetical protein
MVEVKIGIDLIVMGRWIGEGNQLSSLVRQI